MVSVSTGWRGQQQRNGTEKHRMTGPDQIATGWARASGGGGQALLAEPPAIDGSRAVGQLRKPGQQLGSSRAGKGEGKLSSANPPGMATTGGWGGRRAAAGTTTPPVGSAGNILGGSADTAGRAGQGRVPSQIDGVKFLSKERRAKISPTGAVWDLSGYRVEAVGHDAGLRTSICSPMTYSTTVFLLRLFFWFLPERERE
ncbi:unnamed protein product [Calypogeia fissa]